MSENKKWDLSEHEHIWIRQESQLHHPAPLICLLRIRDEELILQDTLSHLSSFADLICVYEDASTDRTRQILYSHPKVAMIIENNLWLPGEEARLDSETRHRGLLLQEARRHWAFNWCMCCDADERYCGPIREFVTGSPDAKPEGIRIQLFDAYMTPSDHLPYTKGVPLLNFRKYFGPERRDILMLWKNSSDVYYTGLDAREPHLTGKIEAQFYCQHYGKSLSIDHWESTCDYYATHFPWNPYGVKWSARKGKAIHHISDFGRELHPWGDALKENAVTNF